MPGAFRWHVFDEQIAGRVVAALFDYVTIACFLGMAGAFFILTAR
jgi:hypothetical protein